MKLTVDIKINKAEDLHHIVAENLKYGEDEGLQAYKVKLYDPNWVLVKEAVVAHRQEEGYIMLAYRMLHEIAFQMKWNYVHTKKNY